MNELSTITNPKIDLSHKIEKVGRFIGNTPLFPVEGLHRNDRVRVFAKLEWQQFGGSVKSRPAYRIFRDAIEEEQFSKGRRLLDASSGNTGIAYAHIGAATGIPVTLYLPENASEERKQILRALGTELRLTSRMGGTDEAQEQAKGEREANPEAYFYADQYNNDGNWKAHYETTGAEIWNQTDGHITHFITGLGTTGTFTGTGKRLKSYNSNIRLTAVQPETAMHGLEGWKHMETAQVPGIYDASLADEHRTISTETAHDMMRLASRKLGLLLSPSSAANLAAATRLADEIEKGIIVTIFPDDGSKYGEVINEIL